MKKFIVSASLATVAIHAFASVEQRVDVSAAAQANTEMVAAIDAALQKREVAQSVTDLYAALMASLSKDGRSLLDQFSAEGEQIAWGDDSTGYVGGSCYGNCYTNCHGACHSACHGSRGWR